MLESPHEFPHTICATEPRGILLNFKCIVDPCDVVRVSVHKFWTLSMGADSVNTAGLRAHYKRRATPDFLAADAIRLHHYCKLGEEDIRARLEKGAVSGMPRSKRDALLQDRAAAIQRDEVEDGSAIAFLQRSETRHEADLSQRSRLNGHGPRASRAGVGGPGMLPRD